jgi:peroxiredoxin
MQYSTARHSMAWLFSLALALLAIPRSRPAEPKEIPNFALLDAKGDYHELRRQDGKAVVLFFTGNGCPIARQCIPKLRKLQAKFQSQGVQFWMIDSVTGDDRESIRKESWEFHNRGIPVLIDDSQGVAAALGAHRTGTAVCIETRGWTVFYQGAIDDQLVEGAQKPAPTANYLADALSQLLAGKEIATASTSARGCIISMGDKEPVSYAKQVAPILEAKCYGCHSEGNIGPRKMKNYAKVSGISDMIEEVLLARRMPPWHADSEFGSFANDISLSVDEKRTILHWIEQGASRGEGDDPLAKATAPNEEWSLGKPDAIVALPVVQQVPATGVLSYRYIKVKAPFDHDVWLKGIVVRPGNTRVVHHVIVRATGAGQKGRDNRDDEFLIGWAPGAPQIFYPEGTGKRLKAGTVLEFEMHYTTSGREETDQSKIGLYLLPEKPKMVLKTRAAYSIDFEIPPGNPNSATFGTYAFTKDTMLYDLFPHMHLRGSWFRFEALYPDGKRETLLSVPHYDFKWQHTYRLKEPRRMPAGSWILCSGGFDNSSRNPDNPDPKASVRWGEQSFEEMFIGFMSMAEIPSGSEGTLAKK